MDELDEHGAGGPTIDASNHVVFIAHFDVTNVLVVTYSQTITLVHNEYTRNLHGLYRITAPKSMANLLH